MSELRILQRGLMDYLLGNDSGAEQWITDQPPLPVAQRLAIYGHAYTARLREALENDHEMLWCYLGDASFNRLSLEYIASHPSRITSLRHYADDLPDFLGREEPYSAFPVLSELAAFERCLLDVFDAADAYRADTKKLTEIPPDHWPGLVLIFHPSVQFFGSRWGAVAIWKALKADETPPPPAENEEQSWLVWRGADRLSQFLPLDEEETFLLQAAYEGTDFAGLCERLAERLDESRVSARMLEYLLAWLDQGLISHLSLRNN